MKRTMPLLALLFAFLAAVFATALHAQLGDPASVLPQLKQGGYVIVFRHGATHRDEADTDPLNPETISVWVPRSDGAGGAKVVLRLQAADWIKAAAGL